MVALHDNLSGTERRRLAGALMKMGVALGVARMKAAAARPVLQPTIFVSRRRGAEVSWQDVVARKV